jgi:hypothetical protein
MIKDLVVNLSVAVNHDPAREYAISLAHAFGAHLAAIAFAYEATDAAKAAGARFEENARRAGLSAESRVLNTDTAQAAELFGRIARRFDLSILRQNEPDKPVYDDLIIEAALFDSGRPVLIVPYIQTEGLKLNRVLVCWEAVAMWPALSATRCRFLHAQKPSRF